ncbi:MAG: TonB-dependent receptor [Candidatus Eremiobacteraeota bacterium]|nr:TonB-dependent receptor [Candidatus Eremiobacteraeota bacterium]
MAKKSIDLISQRLRGIGSMMLIAGCVLCSSTLVCAGTTGQISGTVKEASSQRPLANVTVTAIAPTGRYIATTDPRGYYAITGVVPDTYAISFSRESYESNSVTGVNVFADQTVTVNGSVRPALTEIGRVAARSPGGAYQPNQTVDTYNVTSTQIQQLQGNSLNISETNLITSLPGASIDSSGYPVIRGGRENEEGFQFEGIPYTDAFTNQFVNTLSTPGLGLQQVQLTPGVGNASFQNSGTGTLNLIAKRGNYPGFFTAQVGVGFPNFFHPVNLEYGTASPNGHISEYAAFSGQNTGFLYGDNSLTAAQNNRFFSTRLESDREFLNNLVFRFGRNDTKSLQFFTDIADHHFYQGYGGFDTLCFRTCDPFFSDTIGGLSGLSPGQIQNIMRLDPYQQNPTEMLKQAQRPPYAYYQPNMAYKLQFNDNINPSTFFSINYYRVNSVVTFDFPYADQNPFYPSFITPQGGFSTGSQVEFTKQLSDKHLIKVGGSYAYLHPVYDQVSNNWGLESTIFSGNNEIYDFLPNDANCPAPTGSSCGYLAPYFPNGLPKVPNNIETSASNRQDFSLYLNDTFTPNSKLKLDLGMRMDGANYRLPAARIDPNTCDFLYLPQPGTYNLPPQPTPGSAPPGTVPPGTCPTAKFDVTREQTQPRIFEPVIAASFQLGTRDAVRATYGRSVEFAPLGQIDFYVPPGYYGGFNKVPATANTCGIFGNQYCASYGEQLYWDNQNTFQGVPLQPVKPEIFNNYDLSYSHQFPNGIGFKVTPFYRLGYDATASSQTPKIGPNGQPITDVNGNVLYNPSVVTNLGSNRAAGIELNVTKDAPTGLSGQFTATYINEFSNVIPLSSSEDFFPTIPPASLALHNVYRVGFISPLQTTLALTYKTKNGWRINPQIQYNIGYPLGAGLLGAVFVNGVPYNLPNTNVTSGINGSPQGAVQYIDPMNPGSLFAPNIAATRGTPEGSFPGGKLSHPNSFTNITVEYEGSKRLTYGLTVQNLFNQLFVGPGSTGLQLNTFYQPVATGLSGPLTGTIPGAYLYPQLGFANYPAAVKGQNAYVNFPNGAPRTFYFYVQAKL